MQIKVISKGRDQETRIIRGIMMNRSLGVIIRGRSRGGIINVITKIKLIGVCQAQQVVLEIWDNISIQEEIITTQHRRQTSSIEKTILATTLTTISSNFRSSRTSNHIIHPLSTGEKSDPKTF